jgi:hypothetical protein
VEEEFVEVLSLYRQLEFFVLQHYIRIKSHKVSKICRDGLYLSGDIVSKTTKAGPRKFIFQLLAEVSFIFSEVIMTSPESLAFVLSSVLDRIFGAFVETAQSNLLPQEAALICLECQFLAEICGKYLSDFCEKSLDKVTGLLQASISEIDGEVTHRAFISKAVGLSSESWIKHAKETCLIGTECFS